MSKAEELFGDEILFIPDNDKKKQQNSDWKRPLTKGEYLGHIKDVSTREVSFNGYKATVYNYWVEVAKENDKITYNFDGDYSGDDINGRPVTAVVDRGKPYKNKDGKEIKPWQAKFVKAWDEGEIRNFKEEIPF